VRKIRRDEVLPLGAYEEVRDRFRNRVIAVKVHRRVGVGDRVTFVFENRDTMLFQIQEMLRAERITGEREIQAEIDVYNDLLPGPREISATFFVEITDKERIREDLHGLVGLEVALVLGARRILARFEEGRATPEKLSAVQYLRWPLDELARSALADPEVPARLEIAHPRYTHATDLGPETRRSLLDDLDDWK